MGIGRAMTFRRQACRLVRQAYLREPPFQLVENAEMPGICSMLARQVGGEAARVITMTYYLETVFSLSGYTRIGRLSRILEQRRSLLQGVSLRESGSRGPSAVERRQCVEALWMVRRECLKKGWISDGGRGLKQLLSDKDEARVFIDPGTWCSYPEVDVKVLGKTLSPVTLFAVNFPKYLQYQNPERFHRHFESTMELFSVFVSGLRGNHGVVLRRNSKPVETGSHGP